MRHTAGDLERLIKRLYAGFGRHPSAPELAEVVDVWLDVMRGVPMPELERAVERAVLEPGRFVPKPGELRGTALGFLGGPRKPQLTHERVVWHTDGWTEPCDPDTGAPGLCKCGSDVIFWRQGDSWHARPRHRRHCTGVAAPEREAA